MRISESWLREWVDPKMDTAELAEALTMAGLEVDAIEPAAPDFSGVIVAEILSAEPHPDADKLQVCQVNTGADETVQIVCGAANARAGLKTVLATVGAVLPGDLKIKKAKLRGVPSFGMLCSTSELGLSADHDGIAELAVDAPVGESLRDYWSLDDQIIDIDLTPNRGDCLGIAGVAREVGAITQADVKTPEISAISVTTDAVFPVHVEEPKACPRYLGRVISGINLDGVATPLWMQERLRRGGIRGLGPVVDVTNYVLLELGQPMHAFDQKRLKNGIHVRYAKPDETLVLLDETEVTLRPTTLVIADESKPLAIAGVMGGIDSGVSDKTQDLFLEVAFFAPESIAGQARSYGLNTDSAYRFERGVDPDLSLRAIERATGLLLGLVGGKAGPVINKSDEAALPKVASIPLRLSRIQRLLGFAPEPEQITDILKRLGMAVEQSGDRWTVQPPLSRFDISMEADLIEEVGRIYGYNNIPHSTSQAALAGKALPEAEVAIDRIKMVLVDRGYQEAITYSFVDAETSARLQPDLKAIKLANPISSEMSVMRTSLWPGLIAALKYNKARQQTRIRLFEHGLRFISQDNENKQINSLSFVVSGAASPEGWTQDEQPTDYFDVKGDVELLLDMARQQQFRFEARQHVALHPGQSAAIIADEKCVGWLGKIHPGMAKTLDIPANTFLFEMDADILQKATVPSFEKPSRFPSIRRDLAVVVDTKISAAELSDALFEAAGDTLKSANIFDVYQGDGIESGLKSIAFSLILQDYSRTLTDEDIDSVVTQIMDQLRSKYAATLRE